MGNMCSGPPPEEKNGAYAAPAPAPKPAPSPAPTPVSRHLPAGGLGGVSTSQPLHRWFSHSRQSD